MPVIPGIKSSDIPKTNVLPDMTVRFRVNKADYRDVAALKAAGTLKADANLSDGLNLDLVIITEGQYFGRHVFDGVDFAGEYKHRSRQFLDAVEYPPDEDLDTDKLIDAEFIGTIRTQPESKDGKYEARNRVGKFMKFAE